MFYKLIVCFANTHFLSFPPPIFILVCVVAVALSSVSQYWPFVADSKTLTPPGQGYSITSDFYGLINVHRGTVISAIVTVNLLCCI